VRHPQQLIEDNYISNGSNSRILHMRRGCDFVCEFVEIFYSVFSSHTPVLVMFYFVTFVCDTCYGIAGIMNVTNRQIGGVMWILFIVAWNSFECGSLCCIDTVLQQRELWGKALYRCTFINYCFYSKRCKGNYKFSRLGNS
jgi:hypothetical protein